MPSKPSRTSLIVTPSAPDDLVHELRGLAGQGRALDVERLLAAFKAWEPIPSGRAARPRQGRAQRGGEGRPLRTRRQPPALPPVPPLAADPKEVQPVPPGDTQVAQPWADTLGGTMMLSHTELRARRGQARCGPCRHCKARSACRQGGLRRTLAARARSAARA